jgi:hypothetical protein
VKPKFGGNSTGEANRTRPLLLLPPCFR